MSDDLHTVASGPMRDQLTEAVPLYHVSLAGLVRPPDDIMAVARVELSEAGFARLMEATGGQAPTSRQLCREVEFERSGAYPIDPVTPPELQKILQDGVLIATARRELSDPGFRALMHSIDWRAPTPQELCAAVEAQRATRN